MDLSIREQPNVKKLKDLPIIPFSELPSESHQLFQQQYQYSIQLKYCSFLFLFCFLFNAPQRSRVWLVADFIVLDFQFSTVFD